MDHTPEKGPSGGRPRKTAVNLRDQWLRARVRPDELHRIEQLARDAGKTPSEYVRDAALTAQIMIKRTRRVAPALLHELSRIGNNLNQIAKICNTTGESRRARAIEIYLDELRPVLKRLYELQ
jgi:Bacterial mobilisation protein (MobC)